MKQLRYFIICLLIFFTSCKEKDEIQFENDDILNCSILNDAQSDFIVLKMIKSGWDLQKDEPYLGNIYISPSLKLSEIESFLNFNFSDEYINDDNISAKFQTNLFDCSLKFDKAFNRIDNPNPVTVIRVQKVLAFKNKRKYKYPSIMLEEDTQSIDGQGKYDRIGISTFLLVRNWEGNDCKYGQMYGFTSPRITYGNLKELIHFKNEDVKWVEDVGVGIVGNSILSALILFNPKEIPDNETVLKCRVYKKKELKWCLERNSIIKDPETLKLAPYILGK